MLALINRPETHWRHWRPEVEEVQVRQLAGQDMQVAMVVFL